jgi:hypothetical protein
MISKLGFRTPRSIPLMYVGSRSALSASRSCVSPDSPRIFLTFCPNDVSERARLDILQITASIDDKSMDDESSRRANIPKQSSSSVQGNRAELEGARVLILTGRFKGEEGACLGRASADDFWAVSPDCTSEILSLAFDKDFALVVDLSSNPNRN